MTKTEIKKALYKEKPLARLDFIRIGTAYYNTTLENGTVVNFEVPVTDMGEADFTTTMEGKLLQRWIVMGEEE